MAERVVAPKSYSSTYLYTKYSEYDKNIFKFIKTGIPVDKKDETFDDIRYEVKKRQVSNALAGILDSNKVILMIDTESLPKPFKVVPAKDANGKLVTYIDCTDIITNENGYKCKRIDTLISRLVSDGINMVYFADPNRFINNSSIVEQTAAGFSAMFTYIIDYEFKIGTMSGMRDKCIYLAAMYAITNILNKDIGNSAAKSIPGKLAGFSKREEEMINLYLDQQSFKNIDTFVSVCSRVLKLPKLNTEIVVQNWMYLYGPGTIFALEMFPAFGTMMSDAYVGAYVNNQKTIEKVAKTHMVEFTKRALGIIEESV